MSARIPDSWVESTFGELNQFNSRTINPAQLPNEEFELYSVPSFPAGKPEYLKGAAIGSTKQTVVPNDVLVCKINPRINRVWQVSVAQQFRQIASSEWIGFRNDVLNANFYRYYFTSSYFRELICADVTGVGGSLTHAQPKKVASFPVPVAPLNEQKRIADKLDAVLARVDACRDRLDRIPSILKRFRQSVLADAASGKLTQAWRQHHPAASTQHVQLRDLALLITKGASPKWQGISYVEPGQEGTLFVTSENVREMKIDVSEPKYVESKFDQKQKRSVLRRGDLLTNIVGASIGRSAIFDSDERANINQAVCLIRLKEDVNRNFILYTLSAPTTLTFMHGEKVDVARANLSLVDIGSIPIAVPSRAEQDEIVRRIEALFAYADRLEDRFTIAHAQVEKLTPATLAKAFRGELLPQDPNDEPADSLLTRITSLSPDKTCKKFAVKGK